MNLRRLLSGGPQRGMTAPCRQGSDMREHITGTELSLELSASVVHREVELCALTSLQRTRDNRRRSRQTAAVVQKYPRELSCKTRRSECHLHSNVDEVRNASPAAASEQHKGGRGLVRGPNPAALQITLLTISTGTSQSGLTVYVQ